MSITGRSACRTEFEKNLSFQAPQRKVLIRANDYNCTNPVCFENGRAGASKFCPTCNGTGYIGVTPLPNNGHLYIAPAATLFYITADIQTGHGLYGSGGDFIRNLVDLGRIEVGDGSMFSKVVEIDRVTGVKIYPDVQGAHVRPDYVRGNDGTIYTVTKTLLVNIGDELICRMSTLQRGAQGTSS